MSTIPIDRRPRDFLSSWPAVGLIYGLPFAAIFASGFSVVPNGARTAVWTLGCAVMAAGCGANALRCRRVHCYFAAPFFLAMAAAALLYGMRQAPWGVGGWNGLGAALVLGAALFTWGPERLLGRKYFDGRPGPLES
jgi:hypothetical protein